MFVFNARSRGVPWNREQVCNKGKGYGKGKRASSVRVRVRVRIREQVCWKLITRVRVKDYG
jgi:hypothetical protein